MNFKMLIFCYLYKWKFGPFINSSPTYHYHLYHQSINNSIVIKVLNLLSCCVSFIKRYIMYHDLCNDWWRVYRKSVQHIRPPRKKKINKKIKIWWVSSSKFISVYHIRNSLYFLKYNLCSSHILFHSVEKLLLIYKNLKILFALYNQPFNQYCCRNIKEMLLVPTC